MEGRRRGVGVGGGGGGKLAASSTLRLKFQQRVLSVLLLAFQPHTATNCPRIKDRVGLISCHAHFQGSARRLLTYMCAFNT